MNIIITEEAKKDLKRFKKVSLYDIEDIASKVGYDFADDEELNESFGRSFCVDHFDNVNNITVFMDVDRYEDSDDFEINVLGVRSGDKRGMPLEY